MFIVTTDGYHEFFLNLYNDYSYFSDQDHQWDWLYVGGTLDISAPVAYEAPTFARFSVATVPESVGSLFCLALGLGIVVAIKRRMEAKGDCGA